MEICLKFTEGSLAKSLKFRCTARYGTRRRSSDGQMGRGTGIGWCGGMLYGREESGRVTWPRALYFVAELGRVCFVSFSFALLMLLDGRVDGMCG